MNKIDRDTIDASLFPGWRPRQVPRWLHKTDHSPYWRLVAGQAETLKSDGLEHILPFLVLARGRPRDARKLFGKANWKRIHHASATANQRRYGIIRSAGLDGPALVELLPRILDIPLRNLSSVPTRGYSTLLNDAEAVLWASKQNYQRPRSELRESIILYRDAERLGVNVNPEWSPRRLQREHDRAALEVAAKALAMKSQPWCAPWSVEVGEFEFTLLCSEADLATEGLAMRHCVAGYSLRARQGKCMICQITGRTRATVEYCSQGVVRQIKGRCNRAVSTATREAAVKAGALLREEMQIRAKKHPGHARGGAA